MPPEDAPGYFQRGICRHATSNRELALADYGEAARRDPGNADILLQRATLFAELEAFSALEDASAAVDLLPERLMGISCAASYTRPRAIMIRHLPISIGAGTGPAPRRGPLFCAMVYRDRSRPADQALADCTLAIAGFSAALRLNGDVPAYVFRGQMRLEAGDLAGARPIATRPSVASRSMGLPTPFAGMFIFAKVIIAKRLPIAPRQYAWAATVGWCSLDWRRRVLRKTNGKRRWRRAMPR